MSELLMQRALSILSVSGIYIAIMAIWYFLGAITQWITAFRWFSTENWVGPIEAMILTIPHALILGFIGFIIGLLFFTEKTAMIIAGIPVVYAILPILMFLAYMFI